MACGRRPQAPFRGVAGRLDGGPIAPRPTSSRVSFDVVPVEQMSRCRRAWSPCQTLGRCASWVHVRPGGSVGLNVRWSGTSVGADRDAARRCRVAADEEAKCIPGSVGATVGSDFNPAVARRLPGRGPRRCPQYIRVVSAEHEIDVLDAYTSMPSTGSPMRAAKRSTTSRSSTGRSASSRPPSTWWIGCDGPAPAGRRRWSPQRRARRSPSGPAAGSRSTHGCLTAAHPGDHHGVAAPAVREVSCRRGVDDPGVMVCGAEQRQVGGGRFLPDDRQIVDHSERGTEHRAAETIGDGHGVIGTLEGDVVIGERSKAWGDRRRLGLSVRRRCRRPWLGILGTPRRGYDSAPQRR